MEKIFGVPSDATISLVSMSLSLLIGFILSIILSEHYKRFANTLANRPAFAQNFSFIILTTTLIITIVKSSLALSLGLVGALSIIRFRTPIKEPEELAYLFVSIAIGLGLGAGQTIPTVIASLIILIVVAGLRWKNRQIEHQNLYLSFSWEAKDTEKDIPQEITTVLNKHTHQCDLRRIDTSDKKWDAVFFIDAKSFSHVSILLNELKKQFPGISVTLIDQNQLPTV